VEDIEWGGIRGLTISPDGNTLVACGSHEYSGPACALLFDLATGELRRKRTSTLKGFYYSAQFHAQGYLLTAGATLARANSARGIPRKTNQSQTSILPALAPASIFIRVAHPTF
jgi:WD40 repeat protein